MFSHNNRQIIISVKYINNCKESMMYSDSEHRDRAIMDAMRINTSIMYTEETNTRKETRYEKWKRERKTKTRWYWYCCFSGQIIKPLQSEDQV